MRMRRIDRVTFNNPTIKQDAMFAFNPQLGADKFFAMELAAARAAAAAKAKAATAK